MTTPQSADNHYDGNWIRVKRLAHGLHQHQLAAKLDINQGRISEWEHGQKPVPADIITRINEILN